jgi:hypothetical protein
VLHQTLVDWCLMKLIDDAIAFVCDTAEAQDCSVRDWHV